MGGHFLLGTNVPPDILSWEPFSEGTVVPRKNCPGDSHAKEKMSGQTVKGGDRISYDTVHTLSSCSTYTEHVLSMCLQMWIDRYWLAVCFEVCFAPYKNCIHKL